MDIFVGIGECKISNKEEDTIKTFALATCVAATAYSPSRKVAGMIHIALPNPIYPEDIISRPCYFATSGMPLLIDKMCNEYGCNKNELVICIYGGANSIKQNDFFRIGEKNIDTIRNALKLMNMKITIEQVSGTLSRTLEFNVATGKVKIITNPIVI